MELNDRNLKASHISSGQVNCPRISCHAKFNFNARAGEHQHPTAAISSALQMWSKLFDFSIAEITMCCQEKRKEEILFLSAFTPRTWSQNVMVQVSSFAD